MAFDFKYPGGWTDSIQLTGLNLHMLIGILPQEKIEPQPVRVELTLYGNFSQAAGEEDLEHTADYSLVYRELKEWMGSTAFSLLETLAEHSANFLFDRFPAVKGLRLKLSKPLALPEGALASYEILRSREDRS